MRVKNGLDRNIGYSTIFSRSHSFGEEKSKIAIKNFKKENIKCKDFMFKEENPKLKIYWCKVLNKACNYCNCPNIKHD